MRLYLTATGRYVGTQDDAKRDGKGWSLAEVPTDKAGLIDYLNDQLPATPIVEASAPVETFRALNAGVPETKERTDFAHPGRFKLRQGAEADQIAEYILEAEGFVLANIIGACLERLQRLATPLKGE